MHDMWSSMKTAINRRSFVKNGLTAAGVGLLATALRMADEAEDRKDGHITRGDAAMLRFAAAAEIIETDFWVQYNELGGIPDSEVPGGSGNPAFTAALAMLDSDMAQYVHDNTDDEFTHQNFLNAYLASKGAETVSLEPFRTLPGQHCDRFQRKTTNHKSDAAHAGYQLVDALPQQPIILTSIRHFTFPQAIPTLAVGEHTAIPRTDDDTKDPNFLQAIANTAGFHFPTIEQGGNSLYPSMAQRATSVEVCAFSSASAPPKPCTFKPGRTRREMHRPDRSRSGDRVSVTFPDLNSPPFGGEDSRPT